MAHHTAQLHWQRAEGETFTDQRYSRRHTLHFDGGAVLAGSSSPLVVPAPFSDATAVDPEEMFVAALSSCHMLWFLSIAAGRGHVVEAYDDEAIGVMAPDAQRRRVMAVVTLRPRVRFAGAPPGDEALAAMHHEAHAQCFIANSVKTDVRVEPLA